MSGEILPGSFVSLEYSKTKTSVSVNVLHISTITANMSASGCGILLISGASFHVEESLNEVLSLIDDLREL